MITILIILNLIGGFVFYNLSEKTKTPDNVSLFNWLHQNERLCKIVGRILFFIALAVSVFSFGFLSGTLLWFLLLSLQLCLIIVITPLEIINYKWLGVLVVLSLIVEILVK